MKKIMALMTVLIMVLAMTACSNIEPSDDGSDANMINVKIEIEYPDVEDKELFDDDGDKDADELPAGSEEKRDIEAKMTVEEGTTAIEMLYAYADANGIEVVLDESSPTIYVTSIDGVEQTDMAGWVYEVNDEMTMEAADELVLQDGMEITWEYTSWSDF